MISLKYTLKFFSDAELGTGTASDHEDGYVPRDMHGNPYIPAPHLKGIMRDELRKISKFRSWHGFENEIFGSPDSSGNNDGIVYFMDAKIKEDYAADPTISVTRTAIEHETGIAKDNSLRRTEAISKGTVFTGELLINPAIDFHIDAVKLSLLAVTNLGGTKSRGKGSCSIIIDSDDISDCDIATLLDIVAKAKIERSSTQTATSAQPTLNQSLDDIGKNAVWKRIIFTPINPLCCPEQPNMTNVIKSGFAVPASAVQGAILTKINSYNSKFATDCFESLKFRTWPLHPAPEGYSESIRVSLSHKVAKLLRCDTSPVNDEFIQDSAIKPYDWRNLPPNSPLKASDGVLLRKNSNSKVELWKSAAMPRVITAHGVINDNSENDGRNLYQVEAMAPESVEGQIFWTGIIALPENAAKVLEEIIDKKDNYISLGRSRGVRGLGTFQLEDLDSPVSETDRYPTILITQSPVLLKKQEKTDNSGANPALKQSIQQEFADMISKWCNDNGLPGLERDEDDLAVWCNAGVRFGWNRNKAESGSSPRVKAARVILPGAVFCLTSKADRDKLAAALLKGLGEGKERGFGCLLQHTGKAEALYEPTSPEPEERKSTKGSVEATKLILNLFDNIKIEQLPSASQISSLQQCIKSKYKDNSAAINYLKKQLEDRPDNINAIWKACGDDLKKLLVGYSPEIARKSLQMLRDLIVYKAK